ncbi:hypothetical protein [Salinicola rhizosphaerae]|uniref:DUF3108 domain-containing protein n=1 Tax=Salinicola rhizosphaerae TaxID=1443141 RepID=A0ABQ3DU06_9GAMM|nr:hypothetical protein [Salinicola rhizosphaerae]GHB16455.1 hypothetical protein GCM10009038_13740 [Salinicola rhizosphaerae]
MLAMIRRGITAVAVLAAIGCAPLSLAAPAPDPTPFTARYKLAIDGWPDATITHRLSHGSGGESDVWTSDMQASIKVASGEERGRFRLDDDGPPQALDYTSRYSLLGIGDDYHLGADELQTLPDRQTALFSLSRRAPDARCASAQVSPCELTYQDHKGREKSMLYRVVTHGDVKTPAGTYAGVTVDTWDPDPDKRDRHLFLTFSSEIAGLLLGSRYVKDGKESSHLELLSITRDRPAASD